MTKQQATNAKPSQDSMSGTETGPDRSAGSSQREPAEILREILDDPTVTVAEKINAAKALDAIQKRGAEVREGRASRMTRAELVGEIQRLRAMLGVEGA